jgi:ATP-dependent DNA helicase DinG
MSSFELLGQSGPFAQANQQFQVRQQQQEMAAKIEETIQYNGTLVAESGTGTGKTFAYLVPAIMSGKKVVISTGTKYLQEQLFLRDLPAVSKILNQPVSISMLKGRANYVCLERLEQLPLRSPVTARKFNEELIQLKQWRNRTGSGDIAEVDFVEEKSSFWGEVTSNADNCIGSECQHFESCFVNKARKRAQQADVIVINHHLFFADHALKQDGFGQLLPEASVWIYDEAHQLPDIASNFLGQSLSLRQVSELVSDTKSAEAVEKSSVKGLTQCLDKVDKTSRDCMLSLLNQQGRFEWQSFIADKAVFVKRISQLSALLAELLDYLSAASVAGENLQRSYERAVQLSELLERFSAAPPIDQVRWIEVSNKNFRINETPLHIGSAVQSVMGSRQVSRVFTSATLSINHDFSHYLEQMGLGTVDDVDVYSWDSPFNYQQQSMLYVPNNLPAPNHPDFAVKLVDAILPVVQASKGRAFLLFTSYRLMHIVKDYFSGQGFNLFIQGQENKQSLIEKFKTTENALLFATMSFWEGVDVQGDALSCVIIDKLPFESPGDPVLQARLKTIEEAGQNPFMTYSLPRAVISLRQGAGRLIRGVDDRGLLMICDSRIRTARYGQIFLNSLPPMSTTQHQADAVSFLSNSNSSLTPF